MPSVGSSLRFSAPSRSGRPSRTARIEAYSQKLKHIPTFTSNDPSGARSADPTRCVTVLSDLKALLIGPAIREQPSLVRKTHRAASMPKMGFELHPPSKHERPFLPMSFPARDLLISTCHSSAQRPQIGTSAEAYDKGTNVNPHSRSL
jgi:hypothetical protein